MRFVLAVVLVGFVALPLSASAQAGEEGTASEQNAEEPALQLDDAGVSVTPSPPRTADGYTLEEVYIRHAKRGIRRAGIGLGVSFAAFAGGIGMVAAAVSNANVICILECPDPPAWVTPVGAIGGVLTAVGLAGMIVSGINLGRSRQQLHRLKEADHATPRRVQWDLAQSRLVF